MDGTGLACDDVARYQVTGEGVTTSTSGAGGTRRRYTLGQGKKNRKLLTLKAMTLNLVQAGLSAELNDRLESRTRRGREMVTWGGCAILLMMEKGTGKPP
jgi:hypothetical protein